MNNTNNVVRTENVHQLFSKVSSASDNPLANKLKDVYTHQGVIPVTGAYDLFSVPIKALDHFQAKFHVKVIATNGTDLDLINDGGVLMCAVKGSSVQGAAQDDGLLNDTLGQEICTSLGPESDTWAPDNMPGRVEDGKLIVRHQINLDTNMELSEGYPLLVIEMEIFSGQVPTWLI